MEELKNKLRRQARLLGFDAISVCSLARFELWREESKGNPHAANLAWDPFSILPQAKRAILLLRSYQPYLPRPGLVTLSAYYPASQAAYLAVREMRAPLEARGFVALCHPPIPYKPLLSLSGAARYGVNALTATPAFGTRFACQALLTDAPLALDEPLSFDALAPCEGCARCVKACPVNALGRGKLDVTRCLRALPEGEPVPEALRPLLGNSLLGCDICQEACPRNASVAHVPMPEDIARALDLRALLRGEVKPLAPIIGANYARKKRIIARACLIAGNLARSDCHEELTCLADDEYPAVREHARWALANLI